MTGRTVTSSVGAITLSSSNYASYVPLSITSAGTVSSSSGSAIYSNTAKSWVIINAGIIDSTKSSAGVGGIVLKKGGTITNNAGGIVEGELLGVDIAGSAGGSIVNSGTIKALASTGVGVKITAANVTLTNSGSIAAGGSSYDAVSMSGAGDVLVLNPGFAYTGNIVAATSDTLALAGASTATISSLGTNISGFGHTTILSDASWTLYGTLTGTITNSGTVTVSSAFDVNAATLVNSACITGELYLNSYVSLNNTGTITGTGGNAAILGDYDSLSNSGTITNTANGIDLYDGATVTNSVSGLIEGVYAVYNSLRSSGQAMSLMNQGMVIGTGPTGVAVEFRASGNVTNAAGGLLEGYTGVLFQGSAGESAATLLNQGTITGSALNGAVYLGYAGQISNAVGGTISGAVGVQLGVAATTLTNTGSISGTSYGLQLQPGSEVVNTTTGANAGYIYGGSAGIRASNGGPNTIINTGTISGGSSGVYLANSDGAVTNGAGGLIEGASYGVQEAYQTITLTNSGTIEGQTAFFAKDTFSGTPSSNTVINAGTIESTNGGAGVAVQFGAADDRLIVDPGAAFIGTVDGGGGTNTLELATGSGTLYALGSQITNFQSLVVDAGSQWTLTGTPTLGTGDVIDFAADSSMLQFTPGSVAATFDGFATGDTIGLTGVTDATGVSVVNTNTLEVSRADNPAVYLTLNPAQTLTGATFHYATQGGNTFITADDLACFAENTGIETTEGRVVVQDLRVGTMLRMADGDCRPVRWLGWRTCDISRHPAPDNLRPICIRKHAFADGGPNRDLRLSPDHAVRIDDVLVPVRLLVNGATILRETQCKTVTYYHVELDAHDVLLAENLPAESYLDTGNRAMFENAGLPLLLHPATRNDQTHRVAGSCLPLEDDAARVEPIWRSLADRALHLGYDLPPAQAVTDDPDLRVVAGSSILRALRYAMGWYGFLLPAGARTIRLVSRSVVPSEGRPWIEDRRRLGVMVRRITLHGDRWRETIPLDHPSCTTGWWKPERDATSMWRWTGGNAELTLPDNAVRMLEVEVSGMTDYPVTQSIATLSDARVLVLAS